MQKGSENVPDEFKSMLEGATLAQFLKTAEHYVSERDLGEGRALAFDEVGGAWAQKAAESGQHLAAVMIASQSCRSETIIRIARVGIAAHPEETDVVNILIWREIAGLGPLLARDDDEE